MTTPDADEVEANGEESPSADVHEDGGEREDEVDAVDIVEALEGNPEQAWKMLGLVNDWIKHAETKAAGTVATSGVAAGVLYNLLKDVVDPGWQIRVPAFACGVLATLAALAAAFALRPRLWSREEPTSNLYFHHIARRHKKVTRGVDYAAAVQALSVANADLVAEIAGQIWANAHVAKAKYQAASVGLAAVLLAVFSLGLTALAIACTRW